MSSSSIKLISAIISKATNRGKMDNTRRSYRVEMLKKIKVKDHQILPLRWSVCLMQSSYLSLVLLLQFEATFDATTCF